MPKMAPALRDVVQREAYILNLKGLALHEISAEIKANHGRSLSIQAVCKLVQDQRKVVASQMDETTVQEHLTAYVETNLAVQRDAWQRLKETKANAQNVPGMQSNILAAAKNTASALGIATEKGEVKHTLDAVEELRRMLGVDSATV